MQFASACAARATASTAGGSCDLRAGIDSATVGEQILGAHIRRSVCGGSSGGIPAIHTWRTAARCGGAVVTRPANTRPQQLIAEFYGDPHRRHVAIQPQVTK